MTIGELRTLLGELGLLGEADRLCAENGATLAEAHAPGEMKHQRAARVALYRLLHQKMWSWARISDAFNRKHVRRKTRFRGLP